MKMFYKYLNMKVNQYSTGVYLQEIKVSGKY